MIATVKVNGYDTEEVHIEYQVIKDKFVYGEVFYILNNTHYCISDFYATFEFNGKYVSSLEELIKLLLIKNWDNVCWADLTSRDKNGNPHFYIGYKTMQPIKFVDSCKISFSKKSVDTGHLQMVLSDISKYIAIRFTPLWQLDIIELDSLFATLLFDKDKRYSRGFGGYIEEKNMFYLPSVREQGCYYFTSTEEDIKRFKADLIKGSFISGNFRY